MDFTIGALVLFAGNFAMTNFAICYGQLLSIAQNTALFSILGTTYGGDGQVTFGLPDLRGRVPVGEGQGPGLSNYSLGEMAGTETVTLLASQMPIHNHSASLTLSAKTGAGSASGPSGNVWAASTTRDALYAAPSAADTSMGGASATIGNAGSNQPHMNIQPYLAMTYEICLMGIYPSRA